MQSKSRRALLGAFTSCACARCAARKQSKLLPGWLHNSAWYEKQQADAMSSASMAVTYESALQPTKQGLLPGVLSHAQVVYDIGIGAAPNVQYFPNDGFTRSYVGIDGNPLMEQVANDRVQVSEVAQAMDFHFIVGDIDRTLPVPAADADAVLCTLVLCSVADQRHALSELARIVKPGGYIVLVEHIRAYDNPALVLAQCALTPAQTLLAGNCHLDRATDATVLSARGPLQLELYERFMLPGFGPLAPHFACILRKPG